MCTNTPPKHAHIIYAKKRNLSFKYTHTHTHTHTHTAPKTAVSVGLYAVLKVPPTATAAEIKKSYMALALKFHPDKYKGDDVKAAGASCVSRTRI